jgi:lipoprotein-anchoring transpeptidase ErfK/SrfK
MATGGIPARMGRTAGIVAVAYGCALIVGAAALGACTASIGAPAPVAEAGRHIAPDVLRRYATITDEPFPVQAVDPRDLKARNVRQVVDFPMKQPPGTLVVDPSRRFLYLVLEGGKAMRYGVGVGKAGFEFTGEATIARKATWPRWTPTPDMIRRDPERNRRWAGGMPGGESNPFGARALYPFKDGRDTLCSLSARASEALKPLTDNGEPRDDNF